MRHVLGNFLIVAASLAVLGAQAPGESLRVVVIEGEAAVNVIQRKTAVAPIVEVRDRNNLPVPGAVVTFSLAGSKTATFAAGAQALTITTNAAGRAAVSALTPLASGPVQIQVSAAFQGQVATAVISQTNVMTAAQATAAGASSSAGSSGGGLSNTVIAGIGGAAAAGAIAVAVAGQDSTTPASPLSISLTPDATVGIRDVTEFAFAARGGTVLIPAYGWNFGDGFTASGVAVTRTFRSEGTFEVRLSAVGAGETQSANVNVRVGSLTATWVQRTEHHTFRLIVTQQGRSLAGQWIVEGDPGFGSNVSPLSGTITGQRGITISQGGECTRTMAMTVNADLTAMTGTVNSPSCEGANNVAATFTRQ